MGINGTWEAEAQVKGPRQDCWGNEQIARECSEVLPFLTSSLLAICIRGRKFGCLCCPFL